MDSDDDHDDHYQGDETDRYEGRDGLSNSNMSLTGFLFGNIDEKGQLEDDIFDEESKRHLSGLGSLSGLSSLVQEITEDASQASFSSTVDATGDERVDHKSVNAVDYSDIAELAQEEDIPTTIKPADDTGDNDAVEKEALHRDASKARPFDWVPGNKSSLIPENVPSHVGVSCVSPGQSAEDSSDPKINTPLADMLPPELAKVNVQELFPEFQPGEVLRFSRLFKPTHIPHLYKKSRKKKKVPTATLR